MKKIVLLFPGYGSQFVGMGKELYNDHRVVQEYFEQASSCLDINFVKLCFASSDVELSKINHANTALFLIGAAATALLKEYAIPFDMVAGYTHGEYTALFAAGGISFPDGLYLLNKLSGLYQDALGNVDIHALSVSGVVTQDLATVCATASAQGDYVSIALHSTKVDHIIVGGSRALETVKEMLKHFEHAKTHRVNVESALHSPLFDGVVDQFKMYLEKVDFNNIHIPLLRCSDGQAITSDSNIKHHIIEHINSPVRWDKVMESCADADILVEMTPGLQLGSMIAGMYPEKRIVTVNTSSDFEVLKNMLDTQTLIDNPEQSQGTSEGTSE